MTQPDRVPYQEPTDDPTAPYSHGAGLPGDSQSPATGRMPLLSKLFCLCYRSARAPRSMARKLACTPPYRAVSPIPFRRLRSGALTESCARQALPSYGQAFSPCAPADGRRHRRHTDAVSGRYKTSNLLRPPGYGQSTAYSGPCIHLIGCAVTSDSSTTFK
jgi:hypothetical protein